MNKGRYWISPFLTVFFFFHNCFIIKQWSLMHGWSVNFNVLSNGISQNWMAVTSISQLWCHLKSAHESRFLWLNNIHIRNVWIHTHICKFFMYEIYKICLMTLTWPLVCSVLDFLLKHISLPLSSKDLFILLPVPISPPLGYLLC